MVWTAGLSSNENLSLHMAGRMRASAGVLVALLMLSTMPMMAQADVADLTFDSELNSSGIDAYYATGDVVQIQPTISNTGASTTFENDPSCGVILQVTDSMGEFVVDDRNLCRGQSQMIDIASSEVKTFSEVQWDLTTEEGAYVLPGWYTASVLHTATGLFSSHEVHVQTDVVVPSELTLSIEATSRLGPLVSSEEMVLTVMMYNPTSSAIQLPDLGGCLLHFSIDEATDLSSDCLPSFTQIEAFEEVLLEQRLLPSGTLDGGLHTISVALPGDTLSASLDLEVAPPAEAFTSIYQDQLQVDLSGLDDGLFGDDEIMSTSMTMLNVGDAQQSIRFTDTCRAELWIVDDQGSVVFDSRSLKTCNAINMDYSLEPTEEVVFSLPDWTFTDLLGCQISSGTYTAIVEVPQLHLSQSETIDYERLIATNCAQSLPLDMSTSLSGIDSGFDLNITVVPQISEVDLRWVGPCSVTVSIIDLGISDEVHRQASLCNEHDGRHLSLPYSPGNPLVLEVGEVSMIDFNNAPLPDGMYQMIVTLEANPTTSAGFVFEWPIVETVEVQSTIIEEEPEQEESRLVSGTWSGILTEEGTCWILDSPQDGQLLLSLAALGSWAPQQGWSGTYQSISATSAPQCSKFQAPSIELLTVETEFGPSVEQVTEEQSDGPQLVVPQESEAPLATTLLVVITTTSLLSLLVSLVLGNESLRIPSTAAGLWFLGMVGRTHETTDGRYQRGRLMGYLTANPGCHFRALMAALDMSNGQITHHLRILESEEAIWRRKDGRLVRYYPLTNTMNPGMSDAELPVPPLSPDPNSLQGKILSLLDADGPMGEFPTQAELAKRLEKSQQLVSHHLRTLQKFGLVEKRKMGIKNRYKLTREAIFLLESNDDFTRD